jgi:hypothetical protein
MGTHASHPHVDLQGYWSGWGFGTWCNKRKLHDRTVVTIDGALPWSLLIDLFGWT